MYQSCSSKILVITKVQTAILISIGAPLCVALLAALASISSPMISAPKCYSSDVLITQFVTTIRYVICTSSKG